MGMVSLCFFCPALSTRSRQPIKRYKKLLADIFPRSQEEEPNDRKISKLCEYASKNPFRVPKITTYLEQRFYRELRNEQLHSVKVIICIYRKLLFSCKEQMPLFASSLLGIIHILLDQARHDEMRVLGCQALFDFVNNQRDSTYMFNIDGMIPKLCHLAQEIGEEGREREMRSASLQALSAMVWFMGEFSNISTEFDNVISVVLDNYGDLKSTSSSSGHDEQNNQDATGEVVSQSREHITRMCSWRTIVTERGEINVSPEDAKNPEFWARVCLHNIAKLAKEATTIRRVLESFFRYFDTGNLWSPKLGLGLSVLLDMQLIMENLGHNSHFMLAILIKHLDHKNVLKNPTMQIDIVNVATSLLQQTNAQPSVAIIGALSDMMRHLRKSIHCSLDDSNLGAEVVQWNQKHQASVDACLVELSRKVGDAGLILDMMAAMLENLSNIPVMSRTLISTVYRTAQIVASIPNLVYQDKAFPEALFHQLLLAMVCSDHETRVGAHRIFSVVLVPSSVCPRPRASVTQSAKPTYIQRTLSRTVSVFSSSAALFQKVKVEHHSADENIFKKFEEKPIVQPVKKVESDSIFNRLKSSYSRVHTVKKEPSVLAVNAIIEEEEEEEPKKNNNTTMNRLKSGYSRAYSVKKPTTPGTVAEEKPLSSEKEPTTSLRLSSRQITNLLSSIWAQSISPLNKPENYEAIAHTYCLVLLFGRTKNSSHETLIRSFQLAFSLRSIALAGGQLQPSHRRSLFTLATSMIIFTAKAYSIVPLVPRAKVALTNETVDPFLKLVDDYKLQVSNLPKQVYGSKEDNEDAVKSLSAVDTSESQSKQAFARLILQTLQNMSENELSSIREQLLQDFLPDDACPLGTQFFVTPGEIYQCGPKNEETPNTADPLFSVDNDNLCEEPQVQNELETDKTVEGPTLMSADELLHLISDITNQVGRLSGSFPANMPYKEMAGNCEALSEEKQQKISNFMTPQPTKGNSVGTFTQDNQEKEEPPQRRVQFSVNKGGNPFLDSDFPMYRNSSFNTIPALCATEYQYHPNLFQLPSSNPYDNFLKAAGC